VVGLDGVVGLGAEVGLGATDGLGGVVALGAADGDGAVVGCTDGDGAPDGRAEDDGLGACDGGTAAEVPAADGLDPLHAASAVSANPATTPTRTRATLDATRSPPPAASRPRIERPTGRRAVA